MCLSEVVMPSKNNSRHNKNGQLAAIFCYICYLKIGRKLNIFANMPFIYYQIFFKLDMLLAYHNSPNIKNGFFIHA